MRLLVEGRGSFAKYKEVRGPDGSRFAKWKAERRQRILARYGYEPGKKIKRGDKEFVTGATPMEPEARRALRNARKRERQIARAR